MHTRLRLSAVKKGKAVVKGLKVVEAKLFYIRKPSKVSLSRYNLSRDLKEMSRNLCI